MDIATTITCKKCNRGFPVFEEDVEFYKKMQVPEPTLCPHCRQQRRLVWRNEWSFYQRKCDLTGEPIISFISPDKKQKVYSLKAWFADNWDARSFGQNFDFNRPFFEQFKELLTATPHIPLLIGDSENSDYCNYSLGNKNCYLISAADYNEDCYYSGYLFKSKNCVDCFSVSDSELCYECVDCEKCWRTLYSQRCKNCTDCIGCLNLKGQEYHIFNEKLSRENFEKKKKELLADPKKIKEGFLKLLETYPTKATEELNCQECLGNNLIGCKHCFWCFDLVNCQDCRYVSYGGEAKDSMDSNGSTYNELMYETVASPQCYNLRFSTMCWVKSSDLTYCHLCRASQNCFGCVSLYRNKYCILNKQYTKEEYEQLVPRIIGHMKCTGEWGEFFPAWVSPFTYNETVAGDYYPLSKEQAIAEGYTWKDADKREYLPATKEILACEFCGKNYRLIAQESAFYRNIGLNEPTACPDCRRLARVKIRNPWSLRQSNCVKCGIQIHTSFPQNAVNKNIYCEKCYLESVY